jgi:hypothetical protein
LKQAITVIVFFRKTSFVEKSRIQIPKDFIGVFGSKSYAKNK